MTGMILISAENENVTLVSAQRPQAETPRVLEATTVADDLLPALPPPLAIVQQRRALVVNVRCHY